jgi:hypothetical protein
VDQIYAGTSVTPPVVPEAQGVSNPGAAPPDNAPSLRTSPELAPIRRTVVQLGSFAVWRDDTTLHDVTFSFPYEVRLALQDFAPTRVVLGLTLSRPHW